MGLPSFSPPCAGCGPCNPLYYLTVIGGSGSGYYAAGVTVAIVANTPPPRFVFNQWTGAVFADKYAASTTLVMPAANTTVLANYSLTRPPPWVPPPWGGWPAWVAGVTRARRSQLLLSGIPEGGWQTLAPWENIANGYEARVTSAGTDYSHETNFTANGMVGWSYAFGGGVVTYASGQVSVPGLTAGMYRDGTWFCKTWTAGVLPEPLEEGEAVTFRRHYTGGVNDYTEVLSGGVVVELTTAGSGHWGFVTTFAAPANPTMIEAESIHLVTSSNGFTKTLRRYTLPENEVLVFLNSDPFEPPINVATLAGEFMFGGEANEIIEIQCGTNGGRSFVTLS